MIHLDNDLKGGIADLSGTKVTEVSTLTPIDDYEAMLKDKDEDRFEAGKSRVDNFFSFFSIVII